MPETELAAARVSPTRDGSPLTDDEWEPQPPAQIDLGSDLVAAVRRAAGQERLVVRDAGEEVAAIIPRDDFHLLLRLEEEELDRIDAEEVRKALADPENKETIPYERIRAELGL